MSSAIENKSSDFTAALGLGNSLRTGCLIAATLTLMSMGALAMLVVAVLTLFRTRRFYAEVMAARLARAVLRMWGVRVKFQQDQPFAASQTIYVSNHTSTLDVFILIALGLPNTRFFMFGGTRKWLPMAVIGHLIGTFYTPPQTRRSDRVKCFERAERVLRRTGESVYLSPEGARITTGQIGSFNKGAFHLATNLKAPIVSLFIDIPHYMDPGLGFAPLPGTVQVYMKTPISTSLWELDDLESNKTRIRDFYIKMHHELKRRM